VLEIGAGTGYNAALMARIVGPSGAVVAVDIDPGLVDGAAGHLAEAGVSGVELVCADGALGWPAYAPYDRIVLTVGSGDVRPEWVAQLASGGRLLLPLGVRGTQLSVALDLCADGVLCSDSVSRCAFVRLRGVGATSEPGVQVGDGLSVLPVDGQSARPELADTALSAPGAARPAPVPLGGGDLWDGFGLWLGLIEPEACRLLAGPDDPDARGAVDGERMFRAGTARATLGLLVDLPQGPGLAAVLLDRAADSPAPWPVRVQGFGPAGNEALDRVLAALVAWRDAGRPTAADLRLTVVPRSALVGGACRATPAVAVVQKEHCHVFVRVAAT
jgi:protein-L-isoaspartate(D-aspartate) O-methyltransferase